MLDKNNRYVLEDYQNAPVFYSFLPGISGECGIPLWCYYLNRGQAVASFGVQDKDHSIEEFYPAHQAAQRTPMLGFRTFIKTGGSVHEMFGTDGVQTMFIGMNRLEIRDFWEEKQLEMRVHYATLSNAPAAALLRHVTFINHGEAELCVEMLDGLTEIIPYGVTSSAMKEMGQTAKAWMQVKDIKSRVPKFKVRASMQDTANVEQVAGAVFAMGADRGELLPVIADREMIFGCDTALRFPSVFAKTPVSVMNFEGQIIVNQLPCCYFADSRVLKPGEKCELCELYGMSETEGVISKLQKDFLSDGWFDAKLEMADMLLQKLTEPICCETGDKIFDAYARQTFLDNVLRGGYPKKIDGREIVYIYSRKHGDMERDYNYFSMAPEFYSQGNGNFRDVNQNRRTDTQFFPYVGDMNLKRFYNAIQLNGYNPLGVEKTTYVTDDGKKITPGTILEQLMTDNGKEAANESILADILEKCTRQDGYDFIEGYWSDHWTYNLDLLESYFCVFPERVNEILFEDKTYTYRQAENRLLPRVCRYKKTTGGVRQYAFLKRNPKCEKDVPLKDIRGNVVYASLFEKMLSLAIVKMAALDAYGIGLEMEGGKPGWYDALNGLPGLLGSSVAEAVELARLLEYMRDAICKKSGTVKLLKEVYILAEKILKAAGVYQTELESDGEVYEFWNSVNTAKEAFWDTATEKVSGQYISLEISETMDMIDVFSDILALGREKSKKINPDVPATYYYYEVAEYEERNDGIMPLKFKLHKTPDFLEGAVHLLKLKAEGDNRDLIYSKIRASKLYDKQLKMYKVNASLTDASFELGRACAFTPGWLENESVWLHMEYKYLLELLKNGMYEAFVKDWHCAGIPFLDDSVYGRSTLENSSFIASSVNPDKKTAGRGFVARLSGSTAEFLQMWQIMMFGKKPLTFGKDGLTLSFAPVLPDYLIRDKNEIKACFLGHTEVIYRLPDNNGLFPGNYKIKNYCLENNTGCIKRVGHIGDADARAVRQGKIRRITAEITRSE